MAVLSIDDYLSYPKAIALNLDHVIPQRVREAKELEHPLATSKTGSPTFSAAHGLRDEAVLGGEKPLRHL